MLLEQLKEEAIKLPPSDRRALVSAIVASLQDSPVSEPDRSGAIRRMRGLLKKTNLHQRMKTLRPC
jgi:hypothetical protein